MAFAKFAKAAKGEKEIKFAGEEGKGTGATDRLANKIANVRIAFDKKKKQGFLAKSETVTKVQPSKDGEAKDAAWWNAKSAADEFKVDREFNRTPSEVTVSSQATVSSEAHWSDPEDGRFGEKDKTSKTSSTTAASTTSASKAKAKDPEPDPWAEDLDELPPPAKGGGAAEADPWKDSGDEKASKSTKSSPQTAASGKKAAKSKAASGGLKSGGSKVSNVTAVDDPWGDSGDDKAIKPSKPSTSKSAPSSKVAAEADPWGDSGEEDEAKNASAKPPQSSRSDGSKVSGHVDAKKEKKHHSTDKKEKKEHKGGEKKDRKEKKNKEVDF